MLFNVLFHYLSFALFFILSIVNVSHTTITASTTKQAPIFDLERSALLACIEARVDLHQKIMSDHMRAIDASLSAVYDTLNRSVTALTEMDTMQYVFSRMADLNATEGTGKYIDTVLISALMHLVLSMEGVTVSKAADEILRGVWVRMVEMGDEVQLFRGFVDSVIEGGGRDNGVQHVREEGSRTRSSRF